MKPCRLALLGAVLVLVVISGCIQPKGAEGIGVMFDHRPLLFATEVYFNGTQVGKVGGVQVGSGGITRVQFFPTDEFRRQLSDNLVFYVSNGTMRVAKLGNFGYPLENGRFLCGFGSRSALFWFKLQHLLGDAATAAAEQAAFLAQQFQR